MPLVVNAKWYICFVIQFLQDNTYSVHLISPTIRVLVRQRVHTLWSSGVMKISHVYPNSGGLQSIWGLEIIILGMRNVRLWSKGAVILHRSRQDNCYSRCTMAQAICKICECSTDSYYGHRMRKWLWRILEVLSGAEDGGTSIFTHWLCI